MDGSVVGSFVLPVGTVRIVGQRHFCGSHRVDSVRGIYVRTCGLMDSPIRVAHPDSQRIVGSSSIEVCPAAHVCLVHSYT